MSTGYLAPRYEAIRASVVAKWKLQHGNIADTSSDTVDGLVIDLLALFAQVGYDGLGEVYNQHNLGTATGLNIDAMLGPLFNKIRLTSTPTTSAVLLYGTAGTNVPMLSFASTLETAVQFQTTAAATIVAGTVVVLVFAAIGSPTTITMVVGGDVTDVTTSGTAAEVAADVASELQIDNLNVVTAVPAGERPDGKSIVVVTMSAAWTVTTDVGNVYDTIGAFVSATDDGPQSALYGSIVRIGSPVVGWEGIVNLINATPGRREETDGEYKARHRLAIRGIGKCTPRAVTQLLLELGATAVKLYQNLTGAVVNGRPSHSWEFVIDGYDDALIAEVIWLGHTFGTQSFGTTTVVVIDDQGLVDQPRDISFSRPNYRYAHVYAVITPGEGFPNSALSDINNMVGPALEAWGNALGIGRDVYVFEVGVEIGRVLPGIRSMAISLATTASPFSAPAFGPSDLTMGELDYSRWAASRITVVLA